jgi:hypothetical protein
MTLIGLSGRKRSGKDTVCDLVRDLHPGRVTRIAFADALKEEVAQLLGVTVTEIEADKARYRGILQWWGTEWRRHQDPLYWIKRTAEKIERIRADRSADVVVVTDVRFLNEALLIEDLGGALLRVSRPGADTDPDAHSSETALDNYQFRYVIRNHGTLADLRNDVGSFLLVL